MKFSVVVPCLDEARTLGPRLQRLSRQLPGAELLVVDGGSSDGSRAIAMRHARVLESPRGRGIQMNAGARAATGEALLFLHADARLRHDPRAELASLLADPACVAAFFRQRISAHGIGYRWVERAAFWRARRLGCLLGDLGLCVRTSAFLAIGGYPDVPLFEDFGISRRLRKAGRTSACAAMIYSSPRRYEHSGIVRTTMCNWTLTLLYLLGVSEAKLAQVYKPVR